jgi:stage V sporulation protein AE
VKKKVIIVTDGDEVAKKAIEIAVKEIGGRCISSSSGNPTLLTGEEIAQLIKKSKGEPVVVMVDDRGEAGQGNGEQVTEYLSKHREIEIIGALAVASNSPYVDGVHPEISILNNGQIVEEGAVDKNGVKIDSPLLYGDTVENLEKLGIKHIVGIGDIGKMGGKDDISKGVPITVKALKEILIRNNLHI